MAVVTYVLQKVSDIAASIERVMLKHVSFDLVEKMHKTEEEVRTEVDKLLKIVENFQNKISASQYMEQ